MDKPQLVTLCVKILLSFIIITILVIAFTLFCHLYGHRLLSRSIRDDFYYPSSGSRRRRRFAFTPNNQAVVSLTQHGLEPSALRSLPVVIFRSQEFKDALQCSICLGDVLEGEKARVLPKCNHGFHMDCIDMWFMSHKTCPLCRSPVVFSTKAPTSQAHDVEAAEPPPLSYPSSSSSSSLSSHGNNSGDRGLEIEIPTRDLAVDFTTSGSGGCEEFKSPTTPRSFSKSLRRLLSVGKRVSPRSSSNGFVDVERGLREGRD